MSRRTPNARSRSNGATALAPRTPASTADPDDLTELVDALHRLDGGDFTVRLPRRSGARGEIANAFNSLVKRQALMQAEIQRVGKSVGRNGRLDERFAMPDASGSWRSSVETLNGLIDDLVRPTQDMAAVVAAVAAGDLSRRTHPDGAHPYRGEFLRVARIVDAMVERLRSMTSEVNRVAHAVGVEGKLGVRASAKGATGSWLELAENVNILTGNITTRLRNIAQVTTAVANGDLSQKVTVDARGEVGALADTINTMVDQLSAFAAEVTRVAREVGTEGRLGGQAQVPGVSGTWKDLTESVNFMAGNLTDQVRNIAQVTTAVANGDLSQKIEVDARGEVAALRDTINTMVDQLRSFADEVTRVATEVGTEGRLGGQAEVAGVSGTWKDLTESVNFMAGNLTDQMRNIAQVTTAVANGDLSQKIEVDARGEVAALRDTINTMVDQLRSFADEVTRVATEVGTEGRLGGQAEVAGVSGTWKDLTESVNFMAGNLTAQVRNIADVTTAVANGDLTQKITVDVKGEVLELKNTINTMVDQLRSFADEVTRVATEVGTEGRLGGQAEVAGVSGTWKDLTESVNFMAGNLTDQVRNIAQVTTAVAKGDLTQKITVDARGEVAALRDTINTMVDQLSAFAAEVTRVATEVGTEGRLGGQAQVPGVSGTWKDLTESVNFMAGNLTAQVRNIAQVTTSVANGDLSRKITVDVRGEVLELKNTINTMVDQLRSFADEVTRVATEVGTEGRLGGQAEVAGVSGTWKDLTESVNFMAGNLTDQVRNIADVTTAVANGDLSQKITVDVKGEVLELKNTINTMVDQLRSFADEVTRVAREVGTEGRLGGQAEVADVSGTWKDLTESVNFMAGNLTDQVRNIAQVTTAVANGDLSQKITVDARGEVAALRDTINTMVDQLRSFAAEVTRVAREVGTEGRLGGQAHVEGVAGTWKDLTDNVNHLAGNLTSQVRNIAQVTTAVARGDLSQKITVDARGEVAELKNTVNTMVDQLSAFADEVTRVAREVGTEGRLGGQARVPAVSGVWKDLTDNVNSMAGNLTDQVRNIAQVTTAVARGDLSKKITVSARGEILELKDTINTMVDQLSAFAAEVTRVAREVGTEGRLGGQARVQGVSGTWRDLTHNVNQLASNLTTQVRAIGEVSTAVARGDLTRQIAVDAEGEVAELKDNVNQMIANLRGTTQKNAEQDWLKSNLARISGLMQGQRNLETVCQLIMSEVTPLIGADAGAMFLVDQTDDKDESYRLIAGFGTTAKRGKRPKRFRLGEGLVGQAALDRRALHVKVPAGYLPIGSGVGSADPSHLVVLPVLFEDDVLAVLEFASFSPFSEAHRSFFDEFIGTLGIVLNTITANVRTEELLKQSQLLTHELQHTNEEIAEKARLLELQNNDIEVKNREIEAAQVALQERAEQLALSSKYKSEFLANMSHELRTPLNSLLILAKLLSEDAEGNLTSKQIDYAKTIYGAGSDLLALINDILDLSKVEAGKMQLHPAPMPIGRVVDDLVHTFRAGADQKGLTLDVTIADDVPQDMFTDEHRFQQVLRNLLSNALKFTEVGGVRIDVTRAPSDLDFNAPRLGEAPDRVIAFAVTDTGIGVGPEQLRLIFEAFQQADGTTSRRYGGTGLGLSISREITALLSGELRAASELGVGSTFTLYMPEEGDFAPDQVTVTASVTPWAEVALDRPATSPDDRGRLIPDDPRLLLLGDESTREMAIASAHELGFKVLVAADGAGVLETARRYAPDAIVLMPGAGPDIIELLEDLKARPTTRHLPVYVGAAEDSWHQARWLGAAGRLAQPLEPDELRTVLAIAHQRRDNPIRTVIVMSTDERCRHDVIGRIGGDQITTVSAQTGADAIAILDERAVDCIVCDLASEGTDGFALLEELAARADIADIPVVLTHATDALEETDQARIDTLSNAITIRPTESPQELFTTTALYLHRAVAGRIEGSTRREGRFERDPVLLNRRVLIVDDDVRNVFAVSAALEAQGMAVLFADNGRDGITQLEREADVDLVLMDIMMPEMDGYETMREIRSRPALASLPIIALTAKALTGDREKAIAAGASDYVTKPVDIDRLLAVIHAWLNAAEQANGPAS